MCCRGGLGDKTWRHLAVKLSISLFSSFFFFLFICSYFHSAPRRRYITSWQLSISEGCCRSDLARFALTTKKTPHGNTPYPVPPPPLCKHAVDPRKNVYQLASEGRPDGSQRDHSLKSATLCKHCLHTTDSAQRMCTPLWRFFLSRLSAKPVLLAWDDQWFTRYLWPIRLDLQTVVFRSHMHSSFSVMRIEPFLKGLLVSCLDEIASCLRLSSHLI